MNIFSRLQVPKELPGQSNRLVVWGWLDGKKTAHSLQYPLQSILEGMRNRAK